MRYILEPAILEEPPRWAGRREAERAVCPEWSFGRFPGVSCCKAFATVSVAFRIFWELRSEIPGTSILILQYSNYSFTVAARFNSASDGFARVAW